MRRFYMSLRRTSPEREGGQVLALFAVGLLAIVAAVALVIDGGNAYANQRISQNGSDAAAEAGALVLAERLNGANRSDGDVRSAVDGVLAAMEMDVANSHAEYTDIDGDVLGVVGDGGQPPSGAVGVAVAGERDFDTFFARALGINELTATTRATAVAGVAQMPASNLLPVTPPVNPITCDENNDIQVDWKGPRWEEYKPYVVPLCKNGPGNVGWVDWDKGGGASELEAEIYASSGSVTIPSWAKVPQTGNINDKKVETALRSYNGQAVLIPLFDGTCDVDPDGSAKGDCPDENVGGHGSNQRYHFVDVGAFQFCPGNPDSSAQIEKDLRRLV